MSGREPALTHSKGAGDVSQLPPPSPRVEGVRLRRDRCPYCREDVEPTRSSACQGCLTRHHPACWEEARGCSSCGGERELSLSTAAPADLALGIVPRTRAVALLGMLAGVLAVAWLASVVDPQPLSGVTWDVLLLAVGGCALIMGLNVRLLGWACARPQSPA